MAPSTQEWLPPPPLWDLILRSTQPHIFVFDTQLVCRYAAPTGDQFLGVPREALLGQHISRIFPPAANGLRPILERVTLEGQPWTTPQYRYTHRLADAETMHIWAIQATPLRHEAYHGMLLTLSDVLDLVEERDRLQLQGDDLRAQAEQLQRRDAEHTRAAAAFTTQLRTRLTPIWGYLQLLLQRPVWPEAHSLEAFLRDVLLPQIQELSELVRNFDFFSQDGPDTPQE